MLKRAFSLVLFCFLIGCATPKEKGVVVGMSMEEVRSLAGEPTRKKKLSCPKNSRNCSEVWQYDGSSVVFTDGSVVSTQ